MTGIRFGVRSITAGELFDSPATFDRIKQYLILSNGALLFCL